MDKLYLYTGQFCPKCKLLGDCEDVWVGLLRKGKGRYYCDKDDCDFFAPIDEGLFERTPLESPPSPKVGTPKE
jgi:hypothetical protein